MPNWKDLLMEINQSGSTYDLIRRKYLLNLHDLTGRNVIAYYSGWLQRKVPNVEINDSDKNGFMSVVCGLDRSKGLDLILHTPGGDVAATESIVDYLDQMFGVRNIRAIVPQLAMSCGTMISCACSEIIMGKHSNLGPIDPQLNDIPAHGVLEEFQTAVKECKADPSKLGLWQAIIAKYRPTFLGECNKAIEWTEELVKDWLAKGMFAGSANAQQTIQNIVKELGDHALTKSHNRHLSAEQCKAMNLKVSMLEDNQDFQEAVLSVHHAFIHTLHAKNVSKIIENHNGDAFIMIA
ncbi:hypothetical protein [uncultured Mesotoga sp.]|uniref:SDH family Clp fold serine proteinase n=1 Tax=uncultured Mesotoga sp. TaxID=1184400 RepID=UPI0025977F0A|nr:hypothetical protein [uncultured Mesotoga sp.]HNU23900.1 hypothetical protein [Mesotoga sp.]